ncbi:MAG: cyclomaltodextrinase N-terminal domain-containing protein, partial [Bacteroidia bacterium]|nr:cyclomaltodextrinase N-terminal domain-containing protein [Bacteroidia bacterium]NNK71206.1 alpha-amylase [Flavobacteriaceae bacterium]
MENQKQTDSGVPQEVTNSSLQRVEPPNWWIGFNDQFLQLMIHENKIGSANVSIDYPGIELKEVHRARSENYLFIDLEISERTKAGKFDIAFKFNDGSEKAHTYELKKRDNNAGDFVGFDSSDAIFLITPDRFSNGDPANDSFENLKQTGIDRNHDYKRHGGDIKGIINHIDYIHDLGYTAIWPCPLL